MAKGARRGRAANKDPSVHILVTPVLEMLLSLEVLQGYDLQMPHLSWPGYLSPPGHSVHRARGSPRQLPPELSFWDPENSQGSIVATFTVNGGDPALTSMP